MTSDPLDRRLDVELDRLPREVAPRADLWPRIADRIEAEAGSRPARARWAQAWWPQLAAACVLMAVTAVVTWQVARPPAQSAIESAGPSGQIAELDIPVIATPPATPASFGVPALGPDYVAARTLLVSTFEQRLAELPPTTRRKIERNLDDIRRASAELAAALDEHPANPLLQNLLVSTYQDELALFSQINQAAMPTNPRNDL
jgi:hypothetical protein